MRSNLAVGNVTVFTGQSAELHGLTSLLNRITSYWSKADTKQHLGVLTTRYSDITGLLAKDLEIGILCLF